MYEVVVVGEWQYGKTTTYLGIAPKHGAPVDIDDHQPRAFFCYRHCCTHGLCSGGVCKPQRARDEHRCILEEGMCIPGDVLQAAWRGTTAWHHTWILSMGSLDASTKQSA